MLCVPSGFAIISMEKRKLVALHFMNGMSLSSSLSLFHDAMGSSVICDSCISRSDIYFLIHIISLCDAHLTYQF